MLGAASTLTRDSGGPNGDGLRGMDCFRETSMKIQLCNEDTIVYIGDGKNLRVQQIPHQIPKGIAGELENGLKQAIAA
jgi:hypothetical protein